MAEKTLNDEAYEFVKANAVNDGYNSKKALGKFHVPSEPYAKFRKDHGISPETDQAYYDLRSAMFNAIERYNGEQLVSQIETAIKENRDAKLERVETTINDFKRGTLYGTTAAYRKNKNPRTGEQIDKYGVYHPDMTLSGIADKDLQQKIEDEIKKQIEKAN